jgi:hypothetical protein
MHIDNDYLVMGLTEYFDLSARLLESALPGIFAGAAGVLHTGYHHAKSTGAKSALTDDVVAAITADPCNAAELAIYAHAVAVFWRKVAAAGLNATADESGGA